MNVTPPPEHSWISEWQLAMKRMSVAEYCDWVKAGRPGFADRDALKIRGFLRRHQTMASARSGSAA